MHACIARSSSASFKICLLLFVPQLFLGLFSFQQEFLHLVVRQALDAGFSLHFFGNQFIAFLLGNPREFLEGLPELLFLLGRPDFFLFVVQPRRSFLFLLLVESLGGGPRRLFPLLPFDQFGALGRRKALKGICV